MNRLVVFFLFCTLFLGSGEYAYSNENIIFNPVNGGQEVSFIFDGKLYPKGYSLISAKSVLTESSPEHEHLLADLFEASKTGDSEFLLQMWLPKEREEIAKKIKNQVMWEYNSAFHSNILVAELIAVIEYGQYLLCIVRQEVRGSGENNAVYTLYRDANQKLYAINKPSDDYFYNKVLLEGGLAEYMIKKIKMDGNE